MSSSTVNVLGKDVLVSWPWVFLIISGRALRKLILLDIDCGEDCPTGNNTAGLYHTM